MAQYILWSRRLQNRKAAPAWLIENTFLIC